MTTMLCKIELLCLFVFIPLNWFLIKTINAYNSDDFDNFTIIKQATLCDKNITDFPTDYNNSDCYLISGVCDCVKIYNISSTINLGENEAQARNESESRYFYDLSTATSLPPLQNKKTTTSAPANMLQQPDEIDVREHRNTLSSSSLPFNILTSISPQLTQNQSIYLPTLTSETTTTTKDGVVSNKSAIDAKQDYLWPVKREAVVEGDLIIGGLMMVHERGDSITCGPIMPQGGIQALETMLYTIDQINSKTFTVIPNITLGAHVLDDCDKDTYGLEMAVDFIKELDVLIAALFDRQSGDWLLSLAALSSILITLPDYMIKVIY